VNDEWKRIWKDAVVILSHNLYVHAEDSTESLRFDSQSLVEKMKAGPPDCKTRKPVVQSRAQVCLDIVILNINKSMFYARDSYSSIRGV